MVGALFARVGALAQWQSSGLLTRGFRVRPPGAPPAKAPSPPVGRGPVCGPDVGSAVYRRGMARGPSGHIEQLPSGSWRAKVYAGVDPLTRREIRLRETCRTERAAQIALGRLLEQAAVGRQPESNVTVATLMDEYAEIAEWELSTREANEGYIRADDQARAWATAGPQGTRPNPGQAVCTAEAVQRPILHGQAVHRTPPCPGPDRGPCRLPAGLGASRGQTAGRYRGRGTGAGRAAPLCSRTARPSGGTHGDYPACLRRPG